MNDDTISRAAALSALNEYFVRIGKLKRRGLNKGEKAISLDVVGTINSLPPAQPGWIPCSESPMKNNSYLVWMPFAPEGHHITVAEWCGSYWNIKTPITAWMPLPAPYIPEGDDKHEG